MTRSELEALDRDSLAARAEAAGVSGAKKLTKPELVDELLKRDPNPEAKRARGLLGLARDLLARVIERGLHLPDAAERFRARAPSRSGPARAPEAVPTVTLAEIYAAQGHRDRAIRTLEQVLESDPQNPSALTLLTRLKDASVPLPEPVPPEKEDEERPTSTMLPGSAASRDGDEAKVEEPASMLDADQPLPPRYDVDECVAMPVDPTTIYVYWELREETLAMLRKTEDGGSVALHVLVIVPTWDGPKIATREIDVHSSVGDWFLRELPENAVVRVAIGWRSREGGFVPAAHTYAVEPTPETRSPVVADLLVRWTPWGARPIDHEDVKALEVARGLAVQEVRRHAIGAMAREAAAVLHAARGPSALGSSELALEGALGFRPLGASDLHLGASDLSHR